MEWLWILPALPAGILMGSAIWIATGWLYEHQPKWLARYMAWVNRKAGL